MPRTITFDHYTFTNPFELAAQVISAPEPEPPEPEPEGEWEPYYCGSCNDCYLARERRLDGNPAGWRHKVTGEQRRYKPGEGPKVCHLDGTLIEPVVGYLALTNGNGVGRIERICEGSDELVVVEVNGNRLVCRYRDCTIILTEPRTESKGRPISERRANLRRNLVAAVGRAVGEDQLLLEKLYDCIFNPPRRSSYWFWATVAESQDDPRQISYAAEIEHVDNDDRRKRCRLNRFLLGAVRAGHCAFNTQEIERLANLVGQLFPCDYNFTFEVVHGDAVVDGYRFGDYWGSCMQRYPEYVQFYADNPDSVGLVKLMQGGDYVGRALIWYTDQGEVVVDRVYPSDKGPHTTALHHWAVDNGYDYKTIQGACEGALKSERWDYTITMKPSSNSYYPYIDTFKYTDDDPENSNRIKLTMESGEYAFVETDGGYEGDYGGCRCTACGDRVDEDDATYVYDDPYCGYCFEDRFTELDYQVGGRWIHEVIRRDDAAYCDCCEEYRQNRHCQKQLANGNWVCDCCIEAGDVVRCGDCAEYTADYDTVNSAGVLRCTECHDTWVNKDDEEEEAEEEGAINPPTPAEPAPAPAPPANPNAPAYYLANCSCFFCRGWRNYGTRSSLGDGYSVASCGCNDCIEHMRARQEARVLTEGLAV